MTNLITNSGDYAGTNQGNPYQQMDDLLYIYYSNLGKQKTDYYNSENNGKFSQFCKSHGYENIVSIDSELEPGRSAKECLFTDFDPNFPFDPQIGILIQNNNVNPEDVIFYIFQQCFMEKQPPTIQS